MLKGTEDKNFPSSGSPGARGTFSNQPGPIGPQSIAEEILTFFDSSRSFFDVTGHFLGKTYVKLSP